MTIANSLPNTLDVEHIRYIDEDEAFTLMQTALERLITLTESLGPDDWYKPTPCTEWNVRDMVAHQAGGYASGTGYKELIRQYTQIPKAGQLPEDAINALQLAERTHKTPADLIDELKKIGGQAIHNWAYGFRFFKLFTIPHPVPGKLSIRHLMLVIHSRDTWMHRLDICRATGRTFQQTSEHDGRINELVVLDLARSLTGKLGGRAILLVLSGPVGGSWKIGTGQPDASIEIDMLDFNIYASGRFNLEEALKRAKLTGDQNLAMLAFKNFNVLY